MVPVRTFDILDYQIDNLPLEKSLSTKFNGKWHSVSSQEFKKLGDFVAKGLIKIGVSKGDKIALITTNNRYEWNILDYAITCIGAINVPLYPNITVKEYDYILNHSESSYCFVSDKRLYDIIVKVKENVKHLLEVYTFDEIEGSRNWKDLVKKGKSNKFDQDLVERKVAVKSKDTATIIYTSGTTGLPKGVMLSHSNIVSNVLSSSKRIPFERGKGRALSFLPVCHSFERIIHYIYIFNSIEIYFAESLERISVNIKEVKPVIITAVPRLLEKVYASIYAKGNSLRGIKKVLFFWALRLGLKYEPYGQKGYWYQFLLSIARKLIFSKWKAGLGGNLEFIVSGSAALQARLIRIFTAAGITVMEGYGLTETSPVISVNDMRNKNLRIGTVGKPIDGLDVKIAPDGEIIVKGPNVMQGYYRQPELTQQTIINDYLHTGDIGEVDADGFLRITDRKKEIFKNSAGKYISPQGVENVLKQSPFIEHLMVFGSGQKMPAALILIDLQHSNKWLQEQSIIDEEKNLRELVSIPELRNVIKDEILTLNVQLNDWERITKFALVYLDWTTKSGHLTPTLKLRREVVAEKHADLIEKIYK